MAGDLKTQLEIGADVTGATAGIANVKKSLDTLGPAAAKAGRDASAGMDGVGSGAAPAAAKVEASTKNIIGSIQRQIAIMEAGSRSGADYYRVLATQRGVDTGVLKPYLDQLDAATQKQKAAQSVMQTTSGSLNRVGVSAAQTAAALRGVPAQFTDIITALQGGQAPLTVFLQQGGQLKDMFGGAGPAARALGGYVAGLINPFTLAAAAVGALAAAYGLGSREADAYAKAIILTGNAAGTTVGQMTEMARAIAAISGTQGNAAEALAQLASTGQVGAVNLERFALAAVQFERSAGVAIKETAKDFAELGKAPLEATVKLNESMRYLTLSTYEQIKALQDAGRENEAATVAQRAYADAIQSRSGEIVARLGTIERAWIAIKDATKAAFDAALNVGRPDSTEQQLAAAQRRLTDLQARGALGARGGRRQSTTDAEIAAEQELISTLSRRLVIQGEVATAARTATEQVQARIKFDKDGEQFLTKAQRLERELTKARNEGAAAGASQAAIEQRLAGIREKFADKGAARAAAAIGKSQLSLDVDAIRNAGETLVATYTTSERILESVRAAGLLGDREYFQAKRSFIALDAQAKEDATRKELARLQAEKLSGAAALDNQKKIADAQAKISKIKIDAAAQTAVIDNQETGRIRQLAVGYQQAQAAAEAYLQTLRTQNERAVAGVGLGNVDRERNAGVSQIEDRYAQQRLQLESDRRSGAYKEREEDYQRDLALIDDYQARATAAFVDGFDRRLEAQRDWVSGANRGFKNYTDAAADAASQADQFITRSFSSMEDALVKFVRTGKLDFKSFADTVITELIRIQVRAQIANAASGGGGGLGLFSSIISLIGGNYSFNGGVGTTNAAGISGGRAIGGPVGPGGLHPVAERGEPEMLRTGRGTYLLNGSDAGVVQPLARMPGGGGWEGVKSISISNSGAPIQVDSAYVTKGELALAISNSSQETEQRAVRSVDARLGYSNSKTSAAMRSGFGVQPVAR